MEPLAAASFVASVGALGVAAIVAVIVGRKRGIDQVEDRADCEVKRLVEAQAGRLAILEAENRRLIAELAQVRSELAQVKSDLDIEKRVSARERARVAEAGS